MAERSHSGQTSDRVLAPLLLANLAYQNAAQPIHQDGRYADSQRLLSHTLATESKFMEEVLKVVLNTLGGVSVVLTGLFAYLGNLRLEKFKADLTETNTKLKAALESSIHVSKAQFNKEFAIYQQIWILLVALRVKTLSFRPIMDRVNPKESEEDRMQRRLNEFGEAFFDFRDAMEEQRPFYAHSVYECLVEIFDLCHTESIEYQYKEPGWSKENWQNSRENNQKIVTTIDSCCELIRTRISSLSVENNG